MTITTYAAKSSAKRSATRCYNGTGRGYTITGDKDSGFIVNVECFTEDELDLSKLSGHAVIDFTKTESDEPAEDPLADMVAVGEHLDTVASDADVKELLANAGYTQPRNLCKAIRAAARTWIQEGNSRKDFLSGCEALGLNRANASAEWQATRTNMGLIGK